MNNNYGNNNIIYQDQQYQYNNNIGQNNQYDFGNQSQPFTAQKGQQINYNQQQEQSKNDNQSQLVQMVYNANHPTGLTNLSEQSLRRGFVRKVLSIICIQFLITFAFIIPSTLVDEYRVFQQEHRWIAFIALAINIIVMITLYCFRKHCMVVPRNYILLFIFTISEGYLISMITAVAKPSVVLLSAGITFLIVFCLTMYAIKTKTDITLKATTLFYASIAVIVLVIVGSLFRDYIIQTIIGVIIVGLFCFYLVYDIQKLQGNRQIAYSYDDYIIAALDIYIDIIVIFQTILGIAERS